MSRAGNQQKVLLGLLASLRPHWRTDRNLPARIQTLLSRRSFGSRDRRLYRELIYTVLRYLPWIEPLLTEKPDTALQTAAWLAAESPVTSEFRAELLAGWPPCPPQVAGKAEALVSQLKLGSPLPSVLPAWFADHCPEAFEPAQIDALLARAPLWLRLQTSDADAVFSELDSHGWTWRRSPILPSAVALDGATDASKCDAYQRGLFEVQDLGSQMILEAAGIEPGGRWLDACAGAGGKTLQLAGLLGQRGRIDAHDTRPSALAELRSRALRAGIPVSPAGGRLPAAGVVRTAAPIAIVDMPGDNYDGVLVDAPCSSSGTWRRAPHLKWSTTSTGVDSAAHLQRALLERFSQAVRHGGNLVYATCSLSRHENEDVVAAFTAAHPEFSPEAPSASFGFRPRSGGLTILPSRHDTDGFFVAKLRRRASI